MKKQNWPWTFPSQNGDRAKPTQQLIHNRNENDAQHPRVSHEKNKDHPSVHVGEEVHQEEQCRHVAVTHLDPFHEELQI